MKKAILFILWLIMSLIMPACATNDGLTKYEQLEAEAKITGDNSKLDRFEREAEKAIQFFDYKRECMSSKGTVWYCSNGAASSQSKNKIPTTGRIIKDYRKEKFAACGCATAREIREIMRRSGY